METFEIDGVEVLIIHADGGIVRAVQGICPHQEIPLDEGKLQGHSLTCRAHLWQFDISTGKGINPDDCKLAVYPVEIRGEDVFVNVDGITPHFTAA